MRVASSITVIPDDVGEFLGIGLWEKFGRVWRRIDDAQNAISRTQWGVLERLRKPEC
jgi:hypothetical protein